MFRQVFKGSLQQYIGININHSKYKVQEIMTITELQSCQGNIVNVFCESAEVHPDALKGFILVGLRGEG